MTASVPASYALGLAAVLFMVGLAGLLARRNVIFILLSIEIMLNAAGLAFVSAGARWNQPDGQVMFFFVMTMAAAETAVGLALVIQLYHRFRTLDIDAAASLHDRPGAPDEPPAADVGPAGRPRVTVRDL